LPDSITNAIEKAAGCNFQGGIDRVRYRRNSRLECAS
jgi:hypothetical protein